MMGSLLLLALSVGVFIGFVLAAWREHRALERIRAEYRHAREAATWADPNVVRLEDWRSGRRARR